MLLDDTTPIFIYPKKSISDDVYEQYGKRHLPPLIIPPPGSDYFPVTLNYKIRELPLGSFIKNLGRHGISYKDFYISTDYMSLYNYLVIDDQKRELRKVIDGQIEALSAESLQAVYQNFKSGRATLSSPVPTPITLLPPLGNYSSLDVFKK